ncbi:MAG: AmmeMemoRadiSam system protein B [Calditrichaeota bacterium]|nr:MAG: AmmeMemoRadiSam system protein B [Calditrichota bacterium]
MKPFLSVIITFLLISDLTAMERKPEMENRRPRLRYVDVIPVDTEQGPMVALRDPMGLADEVVVVSREALFVLQYLDGHRTTEEIRAEFEKQLGVKLEKKVLDQLLKHLDEHYYLDNERVKKRKQALAKSMLDAKVCVAAHAGISYPAEKEALHRQLQDFFKDQKGAGLPQGVNGLATPVGLIAPHIDLRIGGPTYTYAYRRLAEAPPADVYVILGTGHAGVTGLYSVLPLDFQTPLGRAKVDTLFIRRLQENCHHEIFNDIFLHKSEHTIEFQVVFLQQILGNRPFKIVPILCGFSYHIFAYPTFSKEREIVHDFTRALRETIASYPGRVTVIASVDLAHVGPRYGEKEMPDASFLQKVKQADFQALENVKKVDAEGWNAAISAIEDRYRICGYSPIYTLLASVPATHGEILSYQQGLMDDNKSFVSYCSGVLYK